MTLRVPHPLSLSLLTLAVVVVAVGMQFGIPIYLRQQAVMRIRRLGGSVETIRRGPGWLRQRLGNERMQVFDDTETVNLQGIPFTDDDLAKLRCLKGVRTLNLQYTEVTDVGLKHLARRTTPHDLTALNLSGTNVTVAGMESLAGQTNLVLLRLRGTHVSNDCLVKLKSLTALARLDLVGTGVTAEGIAEIRGALPHADVEY